jgi:ferredoxin-NADP reductase
LHKYSNVLFIIGGAGIAIPLSYLNLLLSSSSKAESIKMIWAVREESFLQETMSIDFRGLLSDERLSLEAYVTGYETASVHDLEEIADMGEHIEGVRIHKGRPNVRQEIVNFAEEAGKGGDVAVTACGPARIADDARASVVEMLGNGYGRMEYFEESFNW